MSTVEYRHTVILQLQDDLGQWHTPMWAIPIHGTPAQTPQPLWADRSTARSIHAHLTALLTAWYTDHTHAHPPKELLARASGWAKAILEPVRTVHRWTHADGTSTGWEMVDTNEPTRQWPPPTPEKHSQ